MKKLIRNFAALATVVCAAFVSSCETGGGGEESDLIISGLDEIPAVYADEILAGNVNFTARAAWSAFVSETTASTPSTATTRGEGVLPWLRLMVDGEETYGGPAGRVNAAIELEPNTTGADRTARITLSAGNSKGIDISVTQRSTTADGEQYAKQYDFYMGGQMYYSYHITQIPGASSGIGWYRYEKNGAVSEEVPFRIIDIAVSGNDVHLIGYSIESENGVAVQRVYHWKNGQEIPLPVTQRNNWVTGLEVVGSDVYISGYEEISVPNTVPAGKKYVAKYWKNGVVYMLGNAAGDDTFAFDIEVEGGDVYVTGTIGPANDSRSLRGYWKNGAFTAIGTTTPTAYWFNDIVVQGGDVHILGAGLTPVENNKVSQDGVYWKNGVATTIGDEYISGGRPGGSSIAVSGQDVYIVSGHQTGYYVGDDTAYLWKNGTITTLGEGWGYAVTVVDGDVYVAVTVSDPGSRWHHEIYKNGVKTNLLPTSSTAVIQPRRLIMVPKSPNRTW